MVHEKILQATGALELSAVVRREDGLYVLSLLWQVRAKALKKL